MKICEDAKRAKEEQKERFFLEKHKKIKKGRCDFCGVKIKKGIKFDGKKFCREKHALAEIEKCFAEQKIIYFCFVRDMRRNF